MTKEQLKALGLTDEQVEKVWGEFDGKYIPKHRFDEINGELKNAKEAVKERDGQLETLKKSTGDVEALNTRITELQAENKAKDEAHAAELKTLKYDTAVNSALLVAKAKNPETVKPLLKSFLEKAELDGDTIKGLDAELKKLTESEDTKFLFEAQQKQNPPPKGFTPGEAKDGAGNTDPNGMTFGDAIRAQIEAQFAQNQN
jgi:DNA repair exonuclease SbcCD ATPase subunit